MSHDLRYVLRSLRRSPLFTLIAVATLALGIGANTAIFSVVRYLLLDPLPLPEPEQLALVYWAAEVEGASQVSSSGYTDPASGASYRSNYSYPMYRSLEAAAARSSVQLTGFNFLRELSVAVGDQPPVVAGGALADGSYFSTLGLRAALGRTFTGADDVPGAPPVAVVSHDFWQRAFGGDPDVLGRTVRVNGLPVEVIGVTAQGFRGLSPGGFFPRTDVTLPLSSQPLFAPAWGSAERPPFSAEDLFWIRLVARVSPGAHAAALEATLADALRPHLPPEALAGAPLSLLLRPGARGEHAVSAESERLLLVLAGVAGVVLLIACVNLAGLMLARAARRERDLAVRRALGAPGKRLARVVLTESLVLAGAGALGGLVLTLAARDLLTDLLTAGLGATGLGTLRFEVPLDWKLAAVSAASAVLAAVLFGLLPALRATRVDPGAHMKHAVAGDTAPRLALGRALLALQIGASVPLVVGAALFLRTIWNLGAVELGFDPRGIFIFRLNPEYAGVPAESYPRVYEDVLRELAALQGVESVTLLENPLMSGISSNSQMHLGSGEPVNILMNAVGPSFFETMRLPLVAGRAPGPQDGADAPDVAVVNEAAVREVFGGASPIGRQVRLGGRDVEIVGVVGDSRYSRVRSEVSPTVFDAALQRSGFGGHHVVIRAPAPSADFEARVRRAVSSVDPDLPVPELRSQVEQIARSNARERVFAQLLTLFGGFALLLASIGIHGVTAYSVARRTSEIGVRIALGAKPEQVLWLILRQVAAVAAVGLAIGIPAALATGPLVRSVLYGVAPADPRMIALAALLMAGVASAAAFLPALRASRIDALVALRND
jgi:predicted permease